ncbi:hypothetical protein I4U23_006468 [Adineta vaga]|nr:hypothetical protein I4U23_006468 [Adineta vaga]
MDKISTDILTTNGSMNPTEKRALSEVIPSKKRSGGNYGSLAKSQMQPTFYICHSLESDDTLQRLALKYHSNIQEIKRINKLWSDAELSLLEDVYIPVNSSQISTLRTLYPTINIVQNFSPTTNRARNTSINANISDDSTSSIRTSDSNVSIPSTSSSVQDYFSKIDQQITTSKKSLQTIDIKSQHLSSQLLNNDIHSSSINRTTNDRHKGIHPSSENQNQREKHISAALERIQREQDDFDGL